MKFLPAPLRGAFTIEIEKRCDDRGFFGRLFCQAEFRDRGLQTEFAQINNSLSKRKGTLRGMHYQLPPAAEVKVVRCIRGAAWDVILDLRVGSETFGQCFGTDLTAENRRMMYVPRGFAHGVLTLEDDTELLYLVSAFYAPQYERGIRWSDPFFAIDWPIEPVEVSEKDALWPGFEPDFHGVEKLRGLQ